MLLAWGNIYKGHSPIQWPSSILLWASISHFPTDQTGSTVLTLISTSLNTAYPPPASVARQFLAHHEIRLPQICADKSLLQTNIHHAQLGRGWAASCQRCLERGVPPLGGRLDSEWPVLLKIEGTLESTESAGDLVKRQALIQWLWVLRLYEPNKLSGGVFRLLALGPHFEDWGDRPSLRSISSLTSHLIPDKMDRYPSYISSDSANAAREHELSLEVLET